MSRQLPPRAGDWRNRVSDRLLGWRPRIEVRDVVIVALLAASLLFTARYVNALASKTLAACDFTADLGSAPLATAASGKASELGVKIVSDSRVQWHSLGCPGVLPPPAPSFRKWARYYRLPVN